MKPFGYSKKRIWLDLFWCVVTISNAVVYNIYSGSKMHWRAYVFGIAAIVAVGNCIYEYSQKYVEISEGRIVKKMLPTTSIEIKEIIHIQKHTSKYIFKTKDKKMIIDTRFMDTSEIIFFEDFVRQCIMRNYI